MQIQGRRIHLKLIQNRTMKMMRKMNQIFGLNLFPVKSVMR